VASLFPWPAAVISAAQRTGGRHDQITASLLYAAVGFLVPVAFIAIYTYLSRTPELLADPADTGYTRTARRRAFVSIVTYPVTAALAFWSPAAALALFIAVPGYFIVTVFTQERAERHRNAHAYRIGQAAAGAAAESGTDSAS
jgi:hypothetical protein